MAKKQKAQDKTDPKDESIELETGIDVDDSSEEGLDPSIKENSEIPNAEEKIKDLEEALLRSRAELDNAFKRIFFSFTIYGPIQKFDFHCLNLISFTYNENKK